MVEEEGRDAESNAANVAVVATVVVAGVSSPGAWSPGTEGYELHLELGGDAEEQVGDGQEQVSTHDGGCENSQGAGSLHFSQMEFDVIFFQ